MKNNLLPCLSMMIIALNLLFVSSLWAQPSLSVPFAVVDGTCQLGDYCISCDGSLIVNGTASATQIKVFNHDGDPNFANQCAQAGGTLLGNDECMLCNQWNPWPSNPNVASACEGGSWTFPIETITATSNMTIQFQSSGQTYYAGACSNNMIELPLGGDEDLDFQLSSLIGAGECTAPAACPNGSTTSGGEDGLIEAFVAPNNATLNFTFNSRAIPDQLLVYVDCIEVIDSGPFSAWRTPAQVAGQVGLDCAPGTVISWGGGSPANPTPFTASINVQAGQNVGIWVVGDNCDDGNTIWELDIDCGRSSKVSYIGKGKFGGESSEDYIEGVPDVISIGNLSKALLIEQFGLNIHPNPASESLNYELKIDEKPYQVMIFDTYGKLMYSTENYGGQHCIQLDQFQSGSYILKAIHNRQEVSQKVQVVK